MHWEREREPDLQYKALATFVGEEVGNKWDAEDNFVWLLIQGKIISDNEEFQLHVRIDTENCIYANKSGFYLGVDE